MPHPPRPILKGLPETDFSTNPLPFASSAGLLDSPHVHFPPTPTMSSTEITHSPFIYDRAPIVVATNVCALPERGDRKLVASDTYRSSSSRIKSPKGGYFHPRAYEATEFESSLLLGSDSSPSPRYPSYDPHDARCPPLMFDHSSSSDSDACGSPLAVLTPSSISIPHISVHLSHNTSNGPFTSNTGSTGGPYPCHPIMGPATSYSHQGSLDMSLPFLPASLSRKAKHENSTNSGSNPGKKKRGKERTAANNARSNGDFFRASQLLNKSCSNSFYDPSLDDCLGGF